MLFKSFDSTFPWEFLGRFTELFDNICFGEHLEESASVQQMTVKIYILIEEIYFRQYGLIIELIHSSHSSPQYYLNFSS